MTLAATRPYRAAALGCLAFALTVGAPLAGLAQDFSSAEYPMLGIGVRARPAYDGSSTEHAEAVPVVRYYWDHWFTRSTRGVLEARPRVAIAPGLAVGRPHPYRP